VLTVRLLPTLFIKWKSLGYVLCAIDIADAFLMVSQKESTQVTCELATGECTASAHLCQSRQANRLGLQVCSNVVVLNSFSHVCESDTVVKPLCPLAIRRPDGSVGMALVLPALTDCRGWFESLLVHSGVSSATRRKATGADHKKLCPLANLFVGVFVWAPAPFVCLVCCFC